VGFEERILNHRNQVQYPMTLNLLSLLTFPNTGNFMLDDLTGTLIAAVAFAAVLYAPGYVLAYATDLFSFRTRPFAERSLWAIATSFLAAPIAAYFLGRIAGLPALCWLFGTCTITTILLLFRTGSNNAWPRRDKLLTAVLAVGWTLFVLLMLIPFQSGHKLYFSVVMADQSYRIAFTNAVLRTGIPPANPLYFAGSPAPMRYFYFWYVLCATVAKLAHVSARAAFTASSIWAGFGLLVTVKLYAQHFFSWTRRQTWFALGLLAVSGASLIPSLGNAILQPALNGDIEWWSVDPIDAWPDSLLWVPHHVASVLCCLLAFLFLWRTLEPLSARTRRTALALAALAFASAFGLSVYVTFGFTLMVVLWLIWLTLNRQPQAAALWRRTAAAGLLATALLVPFLLELAHNAPAPNPSTPPGHLFILSVRRMIDSGLLTGLPLFAHLNATHPILLDQGLRLLLLIPGLAMELGLYGAVLVLLLLRAKRRTTPLDPAIATALFLTVIGFLLTLFISSSTITNNDFGYRAVMLPQFFLTLLTAGFLGSWRTNPNSPQSELLIPPTPRTRKFLYSLLVLGITGFLYGAVLLRAWLPYEAARPHDDNQPGFSQLPADAFAIRSAFADLDRTASPNALVTFRGVDLDLNHGDQVMSPADFYERILVMETNHQMLNAEWKCATHFGGDPNACLAIQAQTASLYAAPAPAAAQARAFCNRFGVHYLALDNHDPTFTSPTGWPAGLPNVATQPNFRILDCAPAASNP
jgi:hypothetical protein